jgi:hypothetical protein
MKIEVNKSNLLGVGDIDLRGPDWFIDDNANIVQKNLTLDQNIFINGHVYFNETYFHFLDSKLEFIAVPAAPLNEVYYYESETHFIFSTDLDVINATITPFIDVSESNFFLRKGYCSPGKTFFSNVYRLKTGSIYYINNRQLDSKNCNYTPYTFSKKNQYKILKKSIKECLKLESNNQKVGVLFSGGVDSLSIAIILEELNIPFYLYTGKEIPPNKENIQDIKVASLIASHKGWSHKVVDINYNNFSIDNINKIVKEMPLASHLSIIFLHLMKVMKNDDITCVYSGQNLDNLYNFGMTGSFSFSRAGMLDIARRYFFSPFYSESFDKSLIARLPSLIPGSIILYGYMLMKKKWMYRLPKSKKELIDNFVNSPENVVFVNRNSVFNKESSLAYIDVRKSVLRYRIQSYTTSGASFSIIKSGLLNDIKPILPFSAENVLPIFNSLEASFSDVLFPKKMIYEIIAEKNSDLLKLIKTKHNIVGAPQFHQWVMNDFLKTKFGKSIHENCSTKCNNLDLSTGALKLACCLSSVWINKVLSQSKSKLKIE